MSIPIQIPQFAHFWDVDTDNIQTHLDMALASNHYEPMQICNYLHLFKVMDTQWYKLVYTSFLVYKHRAYRTHTQSCVCMFVSMCIYIYICMLHIYIYIMYTCLAFIIDVYIYIQ